MKSFSRLKRWQQLDLLKRFAITLVVCERLKFVVSLYELYDFYVEVYTIQESGEVIMVSAFKDTKSLEPYLEQIDISELVDYLRIP